MAVLTNPDGSGLRKSFDWDGNVIQVDEPHGIRQFL
jgi:hypothetical protein